MILKANKYARWYNSIISNPDTLAPYTETHHIHPTAMGGQDVAENRVKLSARQHFVAHRLLTKAVPKKWNDQAWAALRAMAMMRLPGRDFIVTSRLYETLRRKHSEATSRRMKKLWQDPVYRAKMAQSITTEQRRSAALLAISRPDVKARREAACRSRKKHSTVTIEKMKATWASKHGIARKYLKKPKRWTILSPDGQTFSHSMLEDFCRERGLYYPSLRVSRGEPVPQLQRITTKTNVERLNTTGWTAYK